MNVWTDGVPTCPRCVNFAWTPEMGWPPKLEEKGGHTHHPSCPTLGMRAKASVPYRRADCDSCGRR